MDSKKEEEPQEYLRESSTDTLSRAYTKKTFMTGVAAPEKVPIPQEREINLYFGQLTDMINNLDEKVSEVIKYHEKDFFAAFKNRMFAIKSEMEDLKEKASAEKLKMKQEKRLVELERERDWFRKEALKLDKMC